MKYTPTQLAYLAAMIDGEGSITMCDKRVHRRKSRGIRKTKKIYRARVNFTTQVNVCNTDIRLIDWLIQTFGGIVSSQKRGAKTHWKIRHCWVMPTKSISDILPQLLPYLVLKKEQATLMIETRKTFDDNPKALLTSDDIYNRRLEVSCQLRILNQRGVHILPPCCPSA